MDCEYSKECPLYEVDSGFCECFSHLCNYKKIYERGREIIRIDLPEGIKPTRETKLSILED